MATDLSARLRGLRERLGLTVTEMSYLTGIPKRSLDKYMLRENASLPGLEALVALSKGLNVSLDWLVFGSEGKSDVVPLIVERACYVSANSFFEYIMREAKNRAGKIVEGEELLHFQPEEWAEIIADRAKTHAIEMSSSGITFDELESWRRRTSDRLRELFQDRVARLAPRSAPALDRD